MIALSATQGTDDCTTAGREEHRERHDRCLVDHGREQGMKVSTVDASSVVGHVKNGES